MTLAEARVGHQVVIRSFQRPEMEAEVIRMGITVGSLVSVVQKITRGPVVVSSGVGEIAVGYHLARRIVVEPLVSSN